MASSSESYTPGNAVEVTDVLPAAPTREQQPSLDRRHYFREGHPQALGTVGIMIGALTLLFGIATNFYQPSLGDFTRFFIWAAFIYITSGAVAVAAEKDLSLISISLTFNIIAAIVAVVGVGLYALDPIFLMLLNVNAHHFYGGYSAVVAVFQLLELAISMILAEYACRATFSCSCCGAVAPKIKNPGDLGSAEPV